MMTTATRRNGKPVKREQYETDWILKNPENGFKCGKERPTILNILEAIKNQCSSQSPSTRVPIVIIHHSSPILLDPAQVQWTKGVVFHN